MVLTPDNCTVNSVFNQTWVTIRLRAQIYSEGAIMKH